MQPEILAKVIRGETIESIHRGHLIITDGDGKVIFTLGDPENVTFWRSSAKSFQAIPVIANGAAERFGFSDREIALACASHSGERMHTDLAAAMLTKIGLNESDLRCGVHYPFDEQRTEEMIRDGESPTQLHNNCSGKHVAMLALAKHLGTDIAAYDQLDNPVQQAILSTVAEFADVPEADIAIGIDGCAAPNFAIPVRAMARAFARLILPPPAMETETREACRRIVAANIAHPELIGGTGRLDTMLMNAAKGQLVSKIGADGVYSAGVLPGPKWNRGLAIAFKIEDGDDKRARAAIAVDLFRQLEIFSPDTLAEFSPLPVTNRRGDIVGRVESVVKISTVV